MDRSYRITGPVVLGSSNPAEGGTSYGGVARNVAENLARLGIGAALVSVIGDDVPGRALLDDLDRLGIDRWAVRTLAGRTSATYGAVLGPDGELVLGVADMGILDEIVPERVTEALDRLDEGAWVFADANLPPATHARIAVARRTQRLRLAVDTVSVAKAGRLPSDLGAIDLLFTNRDEARALLLDRGREARGAAPEDLAAALLDAGVGAVVMGVGPEGQVLATADGVVAIPALPARVLEVSGAGDALVAATLAAVVEGVDLAEAALLGGAAAALTTEVATAVHPELSKERIRAVVQQHRTASANEPANQTEQSDEE